MRKFNMILSGLIFVVGCGGGNSESDLFYNDIVEKDGSSDVDIEGCKSDRDCKGNRVCEDNICVNPDVVDKDGGAVKDSDIEDGSIEDVKNDNEGCIKTCDEFGHKFNGTACGENIPDECGGFIENCGECDTTENPFAKCGEAILDEEGKIKQIQKQNICGGNCVRLEEYDNKCKNSLVYYKCSYNIPAKVLMNNVPDENIESCSYLDMNNKFMELCCRIL